MFISSFGIEKNKSIGKYISLLRMNATWNMRPAEEVRILGVKGPNICKFCYKLHIKIFKLIILGKCILPDSKRDQNNIVDLIIATSDFFV